MQDTEPSEPIAPTISSQPEPNLSEAKKEEVSHTAESTIKPSHNDSKDADARSVIFLSEIAMKLSDLRGSSDTLFFFVHSTVISGMRRLSR